MLLQDKVVVVTGGARGIGKVYAEGIAAEGAKVVVSDIRDGEETAEGIRAAGGDAVFVQCDVSRGESCDTLARAAQDRYGRIDGLVNNAALYADLKYVPFDQIEEEEWDRVFAVNVKGVWLMTRAVYPCMRPRARVETSEEARGRSSTLPRERLSRALPRSPIMSSRRGRS